MRKALHTVDRQIATVSHELSLRRDLHGNRSQSYIQKHAELMRLRRERYELKIEIAGAGGRQVLTPA